MTKESKYALETARNSQLYREAMAAKDHQEIVVEKAACRCCGCTRNNPYGCVLNARPDAYQYMNAIGG